LRTKSGARAAAGVAFGLLAARRTLVNALKSRRIPERWAGTAVARITDGRTPVTAGLQAWPG